MYLCSLQSNNEKKYRGTNTEGENATKSFYLCKLPDDGGMASMAQWGRDWMSGKILVRYHTGGVCTITIYVMKQVGFFCVFFYCLNKLYIKLFVNARKTGRIEHSDPLNHGYQLTKVTKCNLKCFT